MELIKHWATTLDDYVIDLAWSSDGGQLAVASSVGPISLYEAKSGLLRHTLSGHKNGTNAIAWQPNARQGSDSLASGGQEGCVRFWDAATGQCRASPQIGTESDWIEHIAWQPSGHLLAAAVGAKLAILSRDGTAHTTPKLAPKSISALAWSPQGDSLATAYFGGVLLWQSGDFSQAKTLPYSGSILSLEWSPDARWLVSGNQDRSVHLWQPALDEELKMSGYESRVRNIGFDHSGRWLATGGSSDCCVWDCTGDGPEGREPLMLPHEGKICALTFQNAHGLLAAASQDGAVKLWSVERAKPLRATVTLPAVATRLAWSPDDTQLAIGTEQGKLYVLKCRS